MSTRSKSGSPAPRRNAPRRRSSFAMLSVKKPFKKVGRMVNRSKTALGTGDGEFKTRDHADLVSEPSEFSNGMIGSSTSKPLPKHIRVASLEDPNLPVKQIEWLTRQLLIVCVAYLFGATHTEWLSIMKGVFGYIMTAWATCGAILILGDLQGKKHEFSDQSLTLLEETPSTPQNQRISQSWDQSSSVQRLSPIDSKNMPSFEQPHPAMTPLYMMDVATKKRVKPGQVMRLSNEWIDMDMLAMIRTPDADDPSAQVGTAENSKHSEYFRNKQRRFEFQFRFKVKKSLEGKKVFFAMELDKPLQMGIVQRAFVNAAMGFMKKTNPNFHYNISGTQNDEKLHLAFTVLGSMDRVVVSKPGEAPPELGSLLYEDPDSIKRRKKGMPLDWNQEDTYTMALWSAYLDFLGWKIINLPGIRPFQLTSVLGNQGICVTLYLIDEDIKTDKHRQQDLCKILNLEFSNSEHTVLGDVAQGWHDANSGASPASKRLRLELGEDTNAGDDVAEDDDLTGAELGEGIYIRSGDSVVFRECTSSGEESTCSIAMGERFAVLQEQDVSVIIQKARDSKRKRLIKTGDSVYFKLIQKKGKSVETRYLTIHRGWWLKWTSKFPRQNGFFTIHSQDLETARYTESRAQYLTMGSFFYLKHKRWSRYHVGVAAEPSPTFGGRMLALYNPKSKNSDGLDNEDPYNEDTDGNDSDEGMDPERKLNKDGWMNPLMLCANEPNQSSPVNSSSPNDANFQAPISEKLIPEKLIFSSEHCHVDVPAWIESMHRTERIRQLTYVVRVTHSDLGEDGSDAGPSTKTFARLRTGREVARMMMVGKSIGLSQATSNSKYLNRDYPSLEFEGTPRQTVGKRQIPIGSSHSFDMELTPKKYERSFDEDDSGDEESAFLDYEEDIAIEPSGSNDTIEMILDDGSDADIDLSDAEREINTRRKGRVRKGTKLIGKAAKVTGKLAVKAVKGTGKAAVGAGKLAAKGAGKVVTAPIPRSSKKPPKSEPKAKKRGFKPRLELSKKTMKKLAKIEKKANLNFLAGQLCSPEESCRIVSRVLSRMSSVPHMSPTWKKFNDILISQIARETDQDRWFLDGTAVEIGVAPLTHKTDSGKLVHESLGARCLWESHWREEWCGIYETCVLFYAPSTQAPCLDIAFIDITNIRFLDAGTLSPLPGFYILVVETAWLCHYIAFRTEEARAIFKEKLNDAVEHYFNKIDTDNIEEDSLKKARFWQGFQSLSNSSPTSEAGKWAKVSTGKSSKERIIFNGRRMAFDINDALSEGSDGYAFVEDLLSRALCFDFKNLEDHPESFVEFLDLTSQLRLLPLDEIDLSSPHAFCLFANIYHCLLQHALLLSVNGPIDRKSVQDIMRTSCYEIGKDVFSLSELHCCVLRGKMSKPFNLKPPYPDVPKKSMSYRFYALDFVDPRINFVLNTSDSACPRSVPILKPRDLDQQLRTATAMFLKKELIAEARLNLIILPKVCEVYKYDFGNDAGSCLEYCLGQVDEETASAILAVMESNQATLRYQHSSNLYHPCLQLLADSPGILSKDPPHAYSRRHST